MRPLTAMAAMVALGCTAACGSGGGTHSGTPAEENRGSRQSGESPKSPGAQDGRTPPGARNAPDSGAAPDPRATATKATKAPEATRAPQARKPFATLTEAQLKKAVLATGDVKGFAVEKSGGAGLLGRSSPAAPSRCGPVADLFLFATTPAFEAGVSRGVAPDDESNASVITLALLSYGPGGADEVIDGLRSATRSCTSYRHNGYDYTDVKATDAPDLGDESVAFRLVASIEGAQVPTGYTVVRGGTTLVAFSSMNMLQEDGVAVPAELVAAQLTKLAGSTRKAG